MTKTHSDADERYNSLFDRYEKLSSREVFHSFLICSLKSMVENLLTQFHGKNKRASYETIKNLQRKLKCIEEDLEFAAKASTDELKKRIHKEYGMEETRENYLSTSKQFRTKKHSGQTLILKQSKLATSRMSKRLPKKSTKRKASLKQDLLSKCRSLQICVASFHSVSLSSRDGL